MGDEGKHTDGGGGGDEGKITIDVNGESKQFNAEDIQGLLTKQTEADEFRTKYAPISKALDKFEVDPATFLEQAEGSFAVTRKMIEAGMIDKTTGEIITKEPEPKPKPDLKLVKDGVDHSEKTLEIVNKALGDVVGPIKKQVDLLEKEQVGLLRENIGLKIKGRHKDFSDDNVSTLLARAAANPQIDLWDHAEKLKQELVESHKTAEDGFAKKYGLDIGKLRNDLNEQDDGGGGAASFMKGKIMSFGRGPKQGKDDVTPKEAMIEFMNKRMQK